MSDGFRWGRPTLLICINVRALHIDNDALCIENRHNSGARASSTI